MSLFFFLLTLEEQRRAEGTTHTLKPDPERGHCKPTHTHTHILRLTHGTSKAQGRQDRQSRTDCRPSWLCVPRYVTLRIFFFVSFSLDSFWILTAPVDGTTETFWIIHRHTSQWIKFFFWVSFGSVTCFMFIHRLWNKNKNKKRTQKCGRRLLVPQEEKFCLKTNHIF
jgi:hypothetical protein